MFETFIDRSSYFSQESNPGPEQPVQCFATKLLKYWSKGWCSCHVSSTGCKHSSVIDMKGHQEIGASSASKQKNSWSYVRLNFLSELHFHGCIVHYKRRIIKKAKDTQSICQCIVPSYNQSNKQSQSMFKQSFNQSDNQTSKGVNQSNIERTEMVNEPKMINKA